MRAATTVYSSGGNSAITIITWLLAALSRPGSRGIAIFVHQGPVVRRINIVALILDLNHPSDVMCRRDAPLGF